MAYLDDEFLPIKGRLGNFSIYLTKGGKRIVRKKGGPSREEIKKGANYEVARKNGHEFGRASTLAKVYRAKLAPLMLLAPDGEFNNRLTAQFRKLIQLNTDLPVGEKRERDEDMRTFPRTYFNKKCMVDMVTVSSSNNMLRVHAEPKLLKKHILDCKHPDKPTHFQATALLITQTAREGEHLTGLIESTPSPLSKSASSPVLEFEIPSYNHISYQLLGIAIVFYRLEQGDLVMLGNRSFNGGWLEGLRFSPVKE